MQDGMKGGRRIWQIAIFSFGSRLFCPQCHPPDRSWNSILFTCFAYPYQNLTTETFYLSTNYQIKVIFCSRFFPSAYRQCTVYCATISPSPVRPYPVNLLRHTWLDLGLSWLCALAQAWSLARPVLPNFELPCEPLKTAFGYIVPLPNNQFMYKNIGILLTILYQSL